MFSIPDKTGKYPPTSPFLQSPVIEVFHPLRSLRSFWWKYHLKIIFTYFIVFALNVKIYCALWTIKVKI